MFNNLTTQKCKKRTKKQSPDKVVKEIKRRTRRTFTTKEKIKIVLEARHGEDTIAAICMIDTTNMVFSFKNNFSGFLLRRKTLG